jgi:hypothetical protein
MFKFFKKRDDSIPGAEFVAELEKAPLENDSAEPVPQNDQRKFVCPGCKNKALTIQRSIELGPDSRDDEYSLQAVRCVECDFMGVATYQESRRGAEESWDHICYRMDEAEFESLLDKLLKCRQPSKPKCACDAHNHFGVKNEYGRLNPLEKLEHGKNQFVMRFR